MIEVEIEEEGKKYVVYIGKVKGKDYVEAFDRSVSITFAGNEGAGKVNLMALRLNLLKKAVKRIVNKDNGEEVRNVSAFIDEMDAGNLLYLFEIVEERMNFFPKHSIE